MLIEELKALSVASGKGELHKFGTTMGLFLIAVGLIAFWFSLIYFRELIILGSLFLMLGRLLPLTLKPVYLVWMGLATIFGFIMTRLILSLIFFLIFAPVGLVFRLIRKDHLDERIDHAATSYWKTREAKVYDPTDSEKQS